MYILLCFTFRSADYDNQGAHVNRCKTLVYILYIVYKLQIAINHKERSCWHLLLHRWCICSHKIPTIIHDIGGGRCCHPQVSRQTVEDRQVVCQLLGPAAHFRHIFHKKEALENLIICGWLESFWLIGWLVDVALHSCLVDWSLNVKFGEVLGLSFVYIFSIHFCKMLRLSLPAMLRISRDVLWNLLITLPLLASKQPEKAPEILENLGIVYQPQRVWKFKRPTICPHGNDDIESNDSHIYFCLHAYQTGMIS